MTFDLDHIVLNVVDIEKMLAFYTEILQLPSERLEDFQQGKVPFPSVRLTADTIIDLFPQEIWRKTSPQQVCRPNLNHFCLVCDKADWQRFCARLEKKQVKIEEGPSKRWGAHGSGISIYFRDPEENLIEVRYYEIDQRDQPCFLAS